MHIILVKLTTERKNTNMWHNSMSILQGGRMGQKKGDGRDMSFIVPYVNPRFNFKFLYIFFNGPLGSSRNTKVLPNVCTCMKGMLGGTDGTFFITKVGNYDDTYYQVFTLLCTKWITFCVLKWLVLEINNLSDFQKHFAFSYTASKIWLKYWQFVTSHQFVR